MKEDEVLQEIEEVLIDYFEKKKFLEVSDDIKKLTSL